MAENEAKLDELLAQINDAGMDIPAQELVSDVERRIAQADRALAECKAVLIATEDPNFHPDGWRMNVTDAVLDTTKQKKRLQAYRDELLAATPPPPGVEDLVLEEPEVTATHVSVE